MVLSTKRSSCLVIMLCESVFFSAMLSMAINPGNDRIRRVLSLIAGRQTETQCPLSIPTDSLVQWNDLCNSSQHLRLCKSDRLYIFPSNNEKKTFNEGRRWCKQLAPCEELGDLIAIRDCDQLNDVVNLTNRFINENDISEADVQVWTSKLRDLEHG